MLFEAYFKNVLIKFPVCNQVSCVQKAEAAQQRHTDINQNGVLTPP